MANAVPESGFLAGKRDELKRLVERLGRDFAYASVLGTDVEGKTYEVSKFATGIGDSTWGERGFVVRVWDAGRYAEYAFGEWPEGTAGVEGLVRQVADLFERSGKRDGIDHPKPSDEKATLDFSDRIGTTPEELGPDAIVAELADLKDRMLEVSPLVAQVRILLSYAKVSKVFVSENRDLGQNYFWCSGHVAATARRDGTARQASKSHSGMLGLELLSQMKRGYRELVETAIALLDSAPIVPGEYEVVCSPDATGMIVHEAFGHGVEMDMFLKNRAKARQYMGREVASPLVNMRDGAASARQVSSFRFDDEGNPAGDTLIIEKGILRSGIADAVSAARLGVAPSGNGKRQSFAHKAYTRMTNTFFEPGTDTLEAMIASIRRGYLIENATSGMEDPKDWGIQCMFLYAREIMDGRLSGRLVAPVVMTGYVPELLKNITMISDGMELSGSGACGKGYKEYVKVSSGGPYIKTKARLG
ncbi:MAG: TldD/PmbA family protein [Treponema sp.]|nr:TldD/PmbA family protein [Treponema sp.]